MPSIYSVTRTLVEDVEVVAESQDEAIALARAVGDEDWFLDDCRWSARAVATINLDTEEVR